MVYSFTDVTLVGNSDKISSLTIMDGVIQTPKIAPKLSFSLGSEYCIYPAFINSADVMAHTLLNRVEDNRFFSSAECYKELKSHPAYENIFSEVELLQLNQLKNIFSGTLAVYYPYEEISEEVFASGFLQALSTPKKKENIWTPSVIVENNAGNTALCLGTHSCALGSVNLLEEVCTLADLKDIKSLDMLTKNPAGLFKVNMGSLENGFLANCFLTKKLSKDPVQNLSKIKLADIALVIYNGKPIYGDIEFLSLAKKLDIINTYSLFVDNKEKFLSLRGSQKILKKLKSQIGYLPQFPIQL